jgi:hypothetical protein
MGTPKSYIAQKKPPQSEQNQLNFRGIASSIVMRKTDYYNPSNPPMVSNKRLFCKIGGLGPLNLGTDNWLRAKEKQDHGSKYTYYVLPKT